MYGVEQKIINWLKNLTTQPITNKSAKKASNETKDNASVETNSETKKPSSTAKSEMLETIKNYSDKLNGLVTDDYLQKLEFSPKSKKEIENLANEYAIDNYNLSKVKLDGNIENKREESKQREEKINNSSLELKQNLDKKYSDLVETTQNKAIKNGVSRSSILAESIKNLSEDKIQDYLNVDSQIASELKENANKLKGYETEYSAAVNALEIQKAIDVKKKIDDITKEQQKKLDEVTKYNNSIDEKIYNLKSKGKELPNEKESAEYRKQMLDSALSYYFALDPQVALEEFKSDVDVQYALGDLAKVVENYLKNR